jgi:hypothetical protein
MSHDFSGISKYPQAKSVLLSSYIPGGGMGNCLNLPIQNRTTSRWRWSMTLEEQRSGIIPA